MSQLPIMKKCRRCGRMWSWNPSVNQICCPYCWEKDGKMVGKVKNIFDLMVFFKKKK